MCRKTPSTEEINNLRKKIIKWFVKNEREYPWRKTKDPFKILIAEIMLRRTKADQAKPVYELLFKKYPDIESLARAHRNNVERILFPLGLKWRNDCFLVVARKIKDEYGLKVPDRREDLIKLSGVGDYVAGAVLSFAYGKKEWIVDSNIARLFKRYFGIKTGKETRRDKTIIKIAKLYSSYIDPRKANMALLDFSSLVCVPRKAKCETCPLFIKCNYRIIGINRDTSHFL